MEKKRGPYKRYLLTGAKPPKSTYYNQKKNKEKEVEQQERASVIDDKGKEEFKGEEETEKAEEKIVKEPEEGITKEPEEEKRADLGVKYDTEIEWTTNTIGNSTPLYPDAKLTVTEAFVAIMQLSLKHTFSNSAVEDLTKVLSFMLPENHQFAHSRHLFKKFFSEIERVFPSFSFLFLLLLFISFLQTKKTKNLLGYIISLLLWKMLEILAYRN